MGIFRQAQDFHFVSTRLCASIFLAENFDTNIFFVICSNVLGGCMGSTGPSTVDPKTGKQYGLNFPVITINTAIDK